jgi:hypothetical protein
MAGLDPQRLVLVRATLDDGQTVVRGTGYFVTGNRVLTAAHVLPGAGVREVQVRCQADKVWRPAQTTAAWRDDALDALLIEVDAGLGELPALEWADQPLLDNLPWDGRCYPVAGRVQVGGQTISDSVGLVGTLYGKGKAADAQSRLELSVDAPPEPADWTGASGSPVFVGDKLAGLIKSVPLAFDGQRLSGVAAPALLARADFRQALTDEDWLHPDSLPKDPFWVLVVQSEGPDVDLAQWVDLALDKRGSELEQVGMAPLHRPSVQVNICDALRSPRHWLRLVHALCAAPLAVFDATDFQPAVMLALGVRAVVRRGVTVTSTAQDIQPDQLAKLPFNIQETKLVQHREAEDIQPTDDRYPSRLIASALSKGWRELGARPRYLDLPAYEGVRCPPPPEYADAPEADQQPLMLCPFDPVYDPSWKLLYRTFSLRLQREPARMLDITSPRLVGQALYEGIRWSRLCIVDWSGWRANVFFELGVRLACAKVGPFNLVDPESRLQADTGALRQKALLLALLQPQAYTSVPRADNSALVAAFKRHETTVPDQPAATPSAALAHDATYRLCSQAFDWQREPIVSSPADWLQTSVREALGDDPEASGIQRTLYATNADFSRQVDHSMRERLIAAWHYLEHRWPPQRRETDHDLRRRLTALGQAVLPALKLSTDPDVQALRAHIYEVLDALAPPENPDAPASEGLP